VEAIQQTCPGSAISVVGFSLGGNIVLKWLGERSHQASASIVRGMAVNPPIDLARCTANIALAARGMYDRHFTRLLYRQVQGSPQWDPASPLAKSGRRPRRLIEFDDLFTAPLSGFRDAAHYYSCASAAPSIDRIAVPTLILSAKDDPLIPPSILTSLDYPASVRLRLEDHGGHLGYLSLRSTDADRHWMDWRVVDWLSGRDG
jgi:predicted alpha/beta-fold hydrolase